jgi:hypothetical protein
VEIGTYSKGKQGQKEALKQPEDDKKKLGEDTIGQEKKKGQPDAPAEKKSPEEIALENQKRVRNTALWFKLWSAVLNVYRLPRGYPSIVCHLFDTGTR